MDVADCPTPHDKTNKGRRFLGRTYTNRSLLKHDITLIGIMMVLAGCGMIYEFLLSQYAARVLGATEVAIFGVFTIMIVSMGLGSFAAKRIRDPFTGFAWLELGIGAAGATAVLTIAALILASNVFPAMIATTYGLADIRPEGGALAWMQWLANRTPYVAAFLLGTLIGAEIPLIARVREEIYGMHLEHNTGTIYGADYIGAGIGAALFVFFLLTLPPTTAAVVAATANLVAGFGFFLRYRAHIRFRRTLLSGHLLAATAVTIIAFFGVDWQAHMEDMLYKDHVIHSMQTRYQRVVITKRLLSPRLPPVYALHINGHTQFSSRDESLYHSLLTYPAMAASARHERVLIVGGGDGLALRDVLRWNPKEVVLLDLDAGLIDFFTVPYDKHGETINLPLLRLNNWSFSDPRVDVRIGDAFVTIDKLIADGAHFDTVIVDLPDPNHPDLNKLYSDRFYAKIRAVLSGDGAMAIQSTSPYHAKEAFISIGKTARSAGFANVEQYHANIPSFGEWGWTIATPTGKPASARLRQLDTLSVDDGVATKAFLLSTFVFPKDFFRDAERIKINRVHSNTLYEYHRLGWARENGVLGF